MGLQFPSLSVLPLDRYADLLGVDRIRGVLDRVAELRARLSGRVVWNVSSTAVSGGVAEMVRSLLAYARGAGVDARWVVIEGSPEFFRVTKRIHNALHGSPGDGSPLGEAERALYEHVSKENASELIPLVRARDVVIVHDPQPAGLVPHLLVRGAHVIWRCHVGFDQLNDEVERGAGFLAPYLEGASAYVYSRAVLVPPQLQTRAVVIPPTIDPFSSKSQPLTAEAIRSILVQARIADGAVDDAAARFVREDGTPGRVDRWADVLRQGPPPALDVPLVVQVSRWDALKDPVGVLRGFVRIGVEEARGARLVLAGPDVGSVADDPEGAAVFQAVVAAWQSLPFSSRRRVDLVMLPMADVDENAAIVNALQRHASVIVQKSLHEGFGLTVTEGLWKRRPVVASAVGGIKDQIDDGVHGLLLADPEDLDGFAHLVSRLLGDRRLSSRLGENGHERVLERYLGLHSLLGYGALIERLDNLAPSSTAGAQPSD